MPQHDPHRFKYILWRQGGTEALNGQQTLFDGLGFFVRIVLALFNYISHGVVEFNRRVRQMAVFFIDRHKFPDHPLIFIQPYCIRIGENIIFTNGTPGIIADMHI
ncbi:hypothetical protein D3C80_1756320 [compost metagenome]